MSARKVDVATEADWSWRDDPLAVAALERAARYAADRNPALDFDEAVQEASMWISVRPETFCDLTYDKDGEQIKYWKPDWIYQGCLRDLMKRQAPDDMPYGDQADYEILTQGTDEGSLHGMKPDYSTTNYNRQLVAKLLEAMFNSWVVVDEFRPDPDMPRAKPNPKTSGTVMAHKIDLERAWEKAPLSKNQKAILAGSHGYGWTHKELGQALGLSRSWTTEIADEALGILVDYMNGERR